MKANPLFLLLTLQLSGLPALAASPDAAPPPPNSSLTLGNYIQQVRGDNDAYVGAEKMEQATALRVNEWKLLARPQLIGGAEFQNDERLTNAPGFQGRQTKTKSYSLGLHQTTDFGVDATLSYRYTDVEIVGVDPNIFPTPKFILASPVLDLNFSLYRNFFGRQVSAQRQAAEAQANAEKLDAEYNKIAMNSEAENTYWRLVLARKLVDAAKGNLVRAERINSWFSKRSEMQLSDNSDALQGRAVFSGRKLDSQYADDEERAAARAFNTMRGSNEEFVKEKLDELSYERLVSLTPPPRISVRKDIQAAQQIAIANRERALAAKEAAKPDISAYASLSYNGRDPSQNTAMDQSWSSKYPNNIVGLRLNVPLFFGVAADTQKGYLAQADAADADYKRKAYEAERLWLDLTRRFEDAKKRLALAMEFEKAQMKKADFERTRRSRGRSTTYQVILFEQDFAAAQVARINLEADILNIYAQLKTFGEVQ